jgi:23S rRNA (uridine2552-2'-O)-methyltransferase
MDLQKLQKAHAPNILFLQEDIKSEAARRWVEETLKGEKYACLCSDMSPKLSGIAFKDAYLSYELGLLTLEYARTYLREKGNLVIKFFPGEEFPDFLKILRGQFGKVKVFEPASSRKTSREVYILAMGYRRKAQPPLGSGVGVGVGTT